MLCSLAAGGSARVRRRPRGSTTRRSARCLPVRGARRALDAAHFTLPPPSLYDAAHFALPSPLSSISLGLPWHQYWPFLFAVAVPAGRLTCQPPRRRSAHAARRKRGWRWYAPCTHPPPGPRRGGAHSPLSTAGSQSARAAPLPGGPKRGSRHRVTRVDAARPAPARLPGIVRGMEGG